MKKLNIGMVGYKFMGKAHSNAWIKAPLFFDLPFQPVLKAICGRHQPSLEAFAQKWGWENTETDWKKLVSRPDIDIVDIAVPQNLHYDIALAAAKAGKHIFCEKPMAMNVAQAEEMLAVCKANGVRHYLNHNYRRTPAIALAKQIIDRGEIGQIYHWRATYQQDWIIDPEFPLTWQLRKEIAQAGPDWDLNSHCVDLAHFLVGPIASVSALTKNFISERPKADESSSGNLKADAIKGDRAPVTVEDAAMMLVTFSNGAIGSFEATRFATGRKNRLNFEIYGSKGSLTFDMERMNELQFYSHSGDESTRGFRTILATEPTHPYLQHWWPPGHIIGYEHAFVHAVADFTNAVAENSPIHPDFNDGINIMKVLEAGLEAAASGQRVSVLA